MSRYPYTYAADLLRSLPETSASIGCPLSRSDASRIRHTIAELIGMPDSQLARILADEYMRRNQIDAAAEPSP